MDVIIKGSIIKGKGVFAARDFKKGEEITSDYSINGVEDWTMECNCRSKNCRNIIQGDFMKLDDKTRKRLEPYLEDWYKEESKKES